MKPTPNRQQYIKILQQMTPAQRLEKAFELTAATREMLRTGLQRRYPDANEVQIKAMYLSRLAECHNKNY